MSSQPEAKSAYNKAQSELAEAARSKDTAAISDAMSTFYSATYTLATAIRQDPVKEATDTLRSAHESNDPEAVTRAVRELEKVTNETISQKVEGSTAASGTTNSGAN
ncbi:hypothetical protein IAT40_007562 [Kwoniella sp. CBS 6097]